MEKQSNSGHGPGKQRQEKHQIDDSCSQTKVAVGQLKTPGAAVLAFSDELGQLSLPCCCSCIWLSCARNYAR